MRRGVLCSLGAIVALCALLARADWPRFRGPDGGGVSEDRGLPREWTAAKNVVWKTALPGFGASGPIVVGDKILVTCYSGYGMSEDDPGKEEDLRRHLIALDRRSGKILWDRSVKAELPETPYRSFVTMHGYATSTPVSDGQNVYVFFGRSGVMAFSLDGRALWTTSVGEKTHEWGSASSPILYKNLVIVNACVESESLVALDKATGKTVWKAGGMSQSWATPVLVDLPGGKQELVMSVHAKVLGFDPASGEKLWECEGVPDYVCPSPIAQDGVAYVTGGRKTFTAAVRCGGRGDVTKSHVLWKSDKGSKVGTPVFEDGLLFWVDFQGIAVCLDGKTGKQVYRERIRMRGAGDKVYASLVAADGKLYAASREDGVFVLAAGGQFKQLAHNSLDDTSICNATPAISNEHLCIRSNTFLYCIGNTRQSPPQDR